MIESYKDSREGRREWVRSKEEELLVRNVRDGRVVVRKKKEDEDWVHLVREEVAKEAKG